MSTSSNLASSPLDHVEASVDSAIATMAALERIFTDAAASLPDTDGPDSPTPPNNGDDNGNGGDDGDTFAHGYDHGFEDGLEQGHEEGFTDGMDEITTILLAEYGAAILNDTFDEHQRAAVELIIRGALDHEAEQLEGLE